MSDAVYTLLTTLGRPAFWVSSRPTVVNAAVTARPGAYLLAANHASPYDIPLLMRHCRRHVDFVSIAEVFRRRFTRALYGAMNAFPLDRSRPDTPAVRTILDRLGRGRVIGVFPEGGFRRGEASVLRGGSIRPGVGRIACLAGVPVVPCVILGSERFGRVAAWLPLRQTRYVVAFGDVIRPSDPVDVEGEFIRQMRELFGRHGRNDGLTP